MVLHGMFLPLRGWRNSPPVVREPMAAQQQQMTQGALPTVSASGGVRTFTRQPAAAEALKLSSPVGSLSGGQVGSLDFFQPSSTGSAPHPPN